MENIDRPLNTAKISNLIVPIIVGRTDQDYSLFIAYLLWRIPQIMGTIVQEYNDGARAPDDPHPDPDPDPDPEPEPEPEFGEALVTAYALNIRKGPNKHFEVVGHLFRNDMVQLYEIVEGWARINPDRQKWCSTVYLKTF